MARVVWYFDFISPYAYFALPTLRQLPAGTDLEYRPVLLAGLLKHWGQKGPAEIAPKRTWTYRSCIWHAQQTGVPFRMPAAHPFNSLPYLRLAIAAGGGARAIETIFDALWTTGVNPATPSVLAGLASQLGVDPDALADERVKDQLRQNTERAANDGVFGVPSFVINHQVFWGSDSLAFAVAYLGDPGLLDSDEMRRADALPVGASRPGSA